MEIQNSIDEAKEYSEVFAAIAEILEQFLNAGVGTDPLTVLSRKRDADRAEQNKKEDDKTA